MNGKPRVLVTRRSDAAPLAELVVACLLDVHDRHEAIDRASLSMRLAACEGLLLGAGDPIDDALLAAAPALRVISTASVGYDHVDVAACTRRGIWVTNTPDVVTDATADLGWALMMAAARRVGASERWLRAGHWPGRGWRFDDWLGADVAGRTLGIVGMGRIGRALARRARGFEMPVCYHNRRPLPVDQVQGAS